MGDQLIRQGLAFDSSSPATDSTNSRLWKERRVRWRAAAQSEERAAAVAREAQEAGLRATPVRDQMDLAVDIHCRGVGAGEDSLTP